MENESLSELKFVEIPPLSTSGAARQTSQGQSEYFCLVSTLNENSASQPYTYSAVYLQLPQQILDQIQANDIGTVWASFAFGEADALDRKKVTKLDNDGIVRAARCFLPDVTVVQEIIYEKLLHFSEDSWVGEKESLNLGTENKTMQSSSACTTWFITESCTVNSETGELYNCQINEIRCIEYEIKDTWPEFDWEWEEDYGGSGGNEGGGGGVSNQDDDGGNSCSLAGDPCVTEDGLPVDCLDGGERSLILDGECKDDDPEPCETEDEYIDTMSEQGVLNQLWLESFGPGTGFDQDDRREMGGWLVEDSSGNLFFEPFPGDLDASICHISGVPPPPDGAVAVLHTHPIFPTERIKVESCIDRFIEEEGIIDPDIRDQMRDQLLQTGLIMWQEPSRYDLIYSETHEITSYYMDGTLIEKYYDGTNNTEAYEVYSRCGY